MNQNLSLKNSYVEALTPNAIIFGDKAYKERRELGLNKVMVAAKSLQLCPTLCDPTDGSPPGTPVPGILQARTHGMLISHKMNGITSTAAAWMDPDIIVLSQ